MADNQSDQEKTEEPSAKKLADAKKDGQVPRSRDLNMSTSTLGGAIILVLTLHIIYQTIEGAFKTSFTIPSRAKLTETYMLDVIFTNITNVLLGLSPFFIGTLIITLVAPTLLGGWAFSTKTWIPDFSKLSPLKGIKRMFGTQGLIELIKAILKILLIAFVAYTFFWAQEDDLLLLASESYELAINHAIHMIISSFIIISLSLLLIIGIDVPYQLWNHNKQLKMSFQELKDEFKETEGSPESKARVRNMQREVAQRQMLQAVPDADVIIVNPTHYSVALRYKMEKDAAPIVLAKGADNIAIKIREIAVHHKIPVFTAPLLARAIYHTTEIDKEVPSALFVSVAKVLAYVFQINKAKPGQYPKAPTDLSIPKEYQIY